MIRHHFKPTQPAPRRSSPKLPWAPLAQPTEAHRYDARGFLCMMHQVLIENILAIDPTLDVEGGLPDEIAREIIEKLFFYLEIAALRYGCQLQIYFPPDLGSEGST